MSSQQDHANPGGAEQRGGGSGYPREGPGYAREAEQREAGQRAGQGTGQRAAQGTTEPGAEQSTGQRGGGYVPPPAAAEEDRPGYRDERARAERPGRYREDYERAWQGEPPRVHGFTMLAAALMLLSGVWNFLFGLAAVLRGSFFVNPVGRYAYHITTYEWGWAMLGIGIGVFVTGLALLTDMFWARVVGVIVAGLSAVGNFLFLPYSPVWSVIVIAIDVLIIWALTTPRRRYAT